MAEDEISRKIQDIERKIREAGDYQDARTEAAESAIQRTRQRASENMARLQEKLAHQPTRLDSVIEMHATKGGKINTNEATRIDKWNDGDGNTIYTADKLNTRLPSFDEIRELANKISQQRQVFSQLGPIKQQRIYSSGDERAKKQYKDFLHSNTLGERFEQLKQHPTRP